MLKNKVLTDAIPLLFLIFLEFILPNFTKHKNPFTRKYFVEDLLFLIVNMALGAVLAIFLIKFIYFGRQEWGILRGFSFIRKMPWGWQFALAFVFRDFAAYWMHRYSHCNHFWKFHIAHHESDYLDVAMAFRVHPVNFLLNGSRVPLLILVGFDISVIPILGIIQYVHNLLVHANIKLDFGIFNYIFISPALHRIHHATESKYHHKNYGVYFSIWDQMFGTFINEKNLALEMGIEGHERKNFILTNLIPFFPKYFAKKNALSSSVSNKKAS